jgi:hypothetical protein
VNRYIQPDLFENTENQQESTRGNLSDFLKKSAEEYREKLLQKQIEQGETLGLPLGKNAVIELAPLPGEMKGRLILLDEQEKRDKNLGAKLAMNTDFADFLLSLEFYSNEIKSCKILEDKENRGT